MFPYKISYTWDRRKKRMEKQFYFMEEEYEKNYASAYNQTKDYERKICEKCGGVKIIFNKELEIEIEGRKKGNYYSTVGHFFIDSKLEKVLLNNDISGFVTKEIDKLNKNAEDIKEMIITGEGGFFRKKDGELFEKCDICDKVSENYDRMIGTIISESDWSGDDIFLIKNYQGIPVVSQKFKDVCEKNKIKNVQFIPVEEFELG